MHNQTALRVCRLPTCSSSSLSAPSASGATGTPCWSFSAQPHAPGMTNTIHYARGSTRPSIPETAAPPCAASGSVTVTTMRSTITCTTAQDVAHSPTEPENALKHRKHHLLTPYNTSTWENALGCFKLTILFLSLVHSLCHGFIVGYPVIACTQSPPNSTSIPLYQNEFEDIVKKEIAKNRYIGPAPLATIKSLLGPYQTSPLSMIPKPGRPGKFRLVQNFLFPLNPSPLFPNPSINDVIDASLFPCTWGKFSTIYLLISRLGPKQPPGM